MGKLTKEQYEYRARSAAERNFKNEETAKDNGMSEEAAEALSELAAWRHKFHCDIERVVMSAGGEDWNMFEEVEDIESRLAENGLPRIAVSGILEDMDSIDGLRYDYGDDVPDDDSDEWQDWYDDNYSRIYDEAERVNLLVEDYLRKIDEQYGTSWCPTGSLRIA